MNQSNHNDVYREIIEDSDLAEKTLFPQEGPSKEKETPIIKEEVPVKEEKVLIQEEGAQKSEVVEEKPLQAMPSIKESLMNNSVEEKEDVEIVESEPEATNLIPQEEDDNQILQKESLMNNVPKEEGDKQIAKQEFTPEEIEPLEKEIESVPQKQEEEPLVIIKKEPVVEIKEELSLREDQVDAIKSEENLVNEEEVIQPTIEEVVPEGIPQVEKSYKELRDDLWNKVNPANSDRFNLLNIEDTDQNKSLLNDIAVKITFLDNDLEDNLIKEDEATKKIKELGDKLKVLTN